MSNRQPAFMHIAIDRIEPGTNIRLEGDIASLKRSIEQHGLLQPITVVPTSNPDRVECVFGHRRLAAARAAGLKTIPCLLRPRDPKEIRVLTQLAENRDRRDMTILEEALVYAELHRLGMSNAQIARSVGATDTAVSQRLHLLEFPKVVQAAVHQRTLGLGDALAIPLELARTTDGRTLAAICKRGGKSLRAWIRKELAEAATPIDRKRAYHVLNLDADLVDEVHQAAAADGVTAIEWCTRALRAALDREQVA